MAIIVAPRVGAWIETFGKGAGHPAEPRRQSAAAARL